MMLSENNVALIAKVQQLLIKHLPGKHNQDDHAGSQASSQSLDVDIHDIFRQNQQQRNLEGFVPPYQPVTNIESAMQRAKAVGRELSDYAKYRINLETNALSGAPVDWDESRQLLSGFLEEELNRTTAYGVPMYTDETADDMRAVLPEYLTSLKVKAAENKRRKAEYVASRQQVEGVRPSDTGVTDDDNLRTVSSRLGLSKRIVHNLNARFKEVTGSVGVSASTVNGVSREFLDYVGTRVPTFAARINKVRNRPVSSQEEHSLPEPDLSNARTVEDYRTAIKAWRPAFFQKAKETKMDGALAASLANKLEKEYYQRYRANKAKE